MIIVKLIGGLGNQLFQYALGRHLSIINQTELKLDIMGFNTYKLHSYSLENFNILENFATRKEIEKYVLSSNEFFNKLSFRIKHIIKPQKKIIGEQSLHFNPEILKIGDNNYLDGYWQSEKYFMEIAPVIRKEFTVKTQLTEKNEEIAKRIIKTNSISLHIRRGDYISDRATSKVYNCCDINYYSDAINIIKERVKNPHFFIFSDDHNWPKKNISLNFPITYITHNEADKNYEDLRLMSMCKHHIIANSTFSWWGAWLNSSPEKMVISPKKWFKTDSSNTKDLIPKEWLQI